MFPRPAHGPRAAGLDFASMRTNQALAALVLAAGVTGCGSQDVPTAAPSASPSFMASSPSPSVSAPAQSTTPAVDFDRAAIETACTSVLLALSAIQDGGIPPAERNEEAAGDLKDASDDLDEVRDKTVAIITLTDEVSRLRMALTASPSKTPDTASLREAYDALCVKMQGLDPIA